MSGPVEVVVEADKPTAMEVERAGDILTLVCHRASYGAGWWTDPGTGIDLKQLVRTGRAISWPDALCARFAKALVAEKLMLNVSEIAEAMEGHRKGLMDDKLPDRPMIEVELADAVIRIADLAGALGLDLGGAIAAKLAYNLTRPDHKVEARQAAGGKAY